jgi:hypothetical protein
MPDLTDEEYDALDEYYTKNPPKLSGNGKSGFFAKHAEKGNPSFLWMICLLIGCVLKPKLIIQLLKRLFAD